MECAYSCAGLWIGWGYLLSDIYFLWITLARVVVRHRSMNQSKSSQSHPPSFLFLFLFVSNLPLISCTHLASPDSSASIQRYFTSRFTISCVLPCTRRHDLPMIPSLRFNFKRHENHDAKKKFNPMQLWGKIR